MVCADASSSPITLEAHFIRNILYPGLILCVLQVVDTNKTAYEQIFIFCLLWSFGAVMEDLDRRRLEAYLKKHTKLEMPKVQKNNRFWLEEEKPKYQWHTIDIWEKTVTSLLGRTQVPMYVFSPAPWWRDNLQLPREHPQWEVDALGCSHSSKNTTVTSMVDSVKYLSSFLFTANKPILMK